jgi:hypothetical protein
LVPTFDGELRAGLSFGEALSRDGARRGTKHWRTAHKGKETFAACFMSARSWRIPSVPGPGRCQGK